MEDKIKLFLEYVKKEKELRLEWDKEDGIDVDAPDYKPMLLTVERVKAFIAYRNIRIEEAWYLTFTKGNDIREIKEKIYEYDERRSRRHSLALNSMRGLNEFGEKFGLERFYEGELLEPSDIENYKNIPVRYEETDFFLQFIDSLGRTPSIVMDKYFEEVGMDKDENSFMRELQNSVEKEERRYGMESSFVKDEQMIKFKDADEFGLQQR